MKLYPCIGWIAAVCMTVLLAVLCLGQDSMAATNITADKVENIAAENKYIATGNVVITRDNAIYRADRAIYDEKTQEMRLLGHVVLEDNEFLINTEQADFNAATKTGVLNNAIIFLKRGKNWVRGIGLQKLGDNHYYGKTVYFTSCDSEQYRTGRALKAGDLPVAERPDWCFKGHDSNIYVGDKVTARDVTLRVKDVAALYTPYFQGPAENDRKTGFLMPELGSSSKKGFLLRPSFFWAIDDNRDASVSADYYSKRGAGGALEYRFREPNHEGEWYGYFLRDRVMNQTFGLARISDRYTTPGLQAFLDVNYVNRSDYFTEYGDTNKATISRFMQSSAEVSVPVSLGSSSRAYLLSQYWVNLRQDITEHVPQKLPEAGYVLNPTRIGPFVLSLSASAANFVRDFDPSGQRFDVLPTISHSFGDAVRVTQSVSLRETFYNLTNMENYDSNSNPHREMFIYRGEVQMRFLKRYGSFLHVVEPSVEYNYIPNAKSLPLFDYTELPTKESVVSVGALNRLVFNDFTASMRVSQPYDTFAPAKQAVLPVTVRGNISGPGFPFNFNVLAAYDSRNKKLDTFNSVMSFKIFRDVTLGLGELYSESDGTMRINTLLNASLSKRWAVEAQVAYDVRADHKLRDVWVGVIYKEQCWSVKTLFARKPPSTLTGGSEYSFLFFLELRGFSSIKI
jgi:LPS-assembly protein